MISKLQIVLQHVATRDKAAMTGFFTSLPNPDLILATHGLQIDALYDLLFDSHIASCVQSRRSGVLALDHEIKKDKADDLVTDFIKWCFYDVLGLRDVISQMLYAPLYGYLPVEIYWTIRESELLGRRVIVPYGLVSKPPHWFDFDSYNTLRFINRKEGKTENVSMRKFLLLQHDADYENPYGTSLLSKCFWAYTFKTGTVKLWVKFLEKYGMPWAYAKSPRSTGDTEKEELKDELDGLIQDGVAVLPMDSEIGVVDANRQSSSATYENLAHFCNAEISKAILSQTLTTEQGDTGSYAMSQTHLSVRKDVVDADSYMIMEAMDRLISLILEYNFDTKPLAPTFVMFEPEDVDMKQAERDVKLTQTGQLKFLKKYWMETYGFNEDDIELIDPQATPALPFTSPFAESTWTKSPVKKVRQFGLFNFREIVISPAPKTIDEWRCISMMTAAQMKERGLGNWNGKLFLIPDTWLAHIPTEMIFRDILGNTITGREARKDDDDSRFGFLAYGFEARDGVVRKDFAEGINTIEDNAEVLDELTESAVSKMSKEFKTMLMPVLKAIKSSRNFSEAKKKILVLYPDLDARELKKLLHTALILGDYAGRTTAGEV